MTRGFILLLFSALSFSLSTVFAKMITSSSEIQAIELTFFRFTAGLAAMVLYILYTKKSVRPNNIKFISLRAFFNTIAVIFFFLGIEYTTISKANLLNMTYPVFVFLVAPYINSERSSFFHVLFLLITMAGLYLVIVPDLMVFNPENVNMGDLFSLLSGLLAALAITSLREARKYDESHVILFYLMLVGGIINTGLVIPYFIMPKGTILLLAVATTFFSLAGQVLITVGYKFIDASAGALVSSSRIVFALLLGVSIFSDPLSPKIIIGAILIIISLTGVSGIWKRLPRRGK